MDFPWHTFHLPLIHPHHQHHQPRVATSLRPRPAALAAPSGAAPCAARAGRSWRPSCSSAPPAWHGPGGAQRMLLGWGKSGGKCGRKMSFDTCLRCVFWCILIGLTCFMFFLFEEIELWMISDVDRTFWTWLICWSAVSWYVLTDLSSG